MDPITAFAIATLMMLLNGAVLGMIHHDLPESLRPAAFSWRLGTLLVAGGCVLLAAQRVLPLGLVLPVANAMLMLGLTAYWRALRQFDSLPDRWFLLLPALVGSAGIAWFATIQPNFAARVLFASGIWLVLFLASAAVLYRGRGDDPARSRRALFGIFSILALFMLLRAAYFTQAFGTYVDVLDNRSWMNMATPLVAAILPVVGTTAFLLMCSERIRRQWEHAASTDALTGLANRRVITREGNARLQRTRNGPVSFSLAIIDIDHFKSINDRFGHAIGDLALRHIADTISAAAPVSALCGRQGGEEFVVLLDADRAQAQRDVEHLCEAVRTRPFRADHRDIVITVSIGVSFAALQNESLDDLLRRADQAMYSAKSHGRNRVEFA